MELSQVNRIYTLHRFFSTKKNIASHELCKRLKVSRATLFRDLEMLKDIGAPIDYCAFTRKYYYRTHFQMTLEEFLKKVV